MNKRQDKKRRKKFIEKHREEMQALADKLAGKLGVPKIEWPRDYGVHMTGYEPYPQKLKSQHPENKADNEVDAGCSPAGA